MKKIFFFSLLTLGLYAGTSFLALDWDILREYSAGKKLPEKLSAAQKQKVKMPGFMIPLEDYAEMTSEFLLVPVPMACIHVPAPPPNQIVHVKMKKNTQVPLIFYEPVWVYGDLRIEKKKNIYASSLFFLSGDDVEIYDE